MHRPLFLEGEAGVGKTALAHALAEVTGRPIYRLQCYEGLEASQALYDWDFGRQLLHLRAAEAAHANDDTARAGGLPLRPALPARPAAAAGARGLPQRAAGRRGRPRRRRVRGVPAGGALATSRSRSRSWARSGRRPRRWCPHLQPHPRGARRPQAPLPLPLAGAPRLRPRGRDPAPPAAGGDRAAGPRGRPGDREAAHARPAQAARASPRPWTGRPRCTPSAPATSTRTSPPARWAPSSSTARTPTGCTPWPGGRSSVADSRPAADATSSTPCSGSPARCAHAGVAASPDRVEAMLAALGSLDVLDPTDVYWAGRLTLCGGPDDLDRYDAAFAAYFAGEAPRPRAPQPTAAAAAAGDHRAAGARHRRGRRRRRHPRPRHPGQRRRGAAAPGRRRA